MGGCSSRPKTAEFEGALDMQEENPQDEAVRSSEVGRIAVDAGLKGINKEQETSENGILNHIVEEEGDDLRDMLAETTKHLNAGFDAEGEYKGERQMLEDDHSSMKEEGKDRQAALKENTPELENGSKNLAKASSKVHEDPILIDVDAIEHQETSMISNIGADTMGSLEHPKRGMVVQDQLVKYKCETQGVDKLTSHDKGAPHLQEETITLNDDCMNSGKDVYIEAERTFVLLKSAVPKDMGLETQSDLFEEKKREVSLESKEVGHGNEGPMLVASPRQKKQSGTAEMEPQDASGEARKGAVEMESREEHENGCQRLDSHPRREEQFEKSKECHIAANGACFPDNHSKEIGKEVLCEKRLRLGKDMSVKDEAIDTASLDVSANCQQSLAFKCSCSRDGGVCEEPMQAKVVHDAASTCAFARSSAKLQAEPISKHLLSVDNGLQKYSSGDVVSDESWYILEKVDVANNHPSAVTLKEQFHTELPKNGVVPREISRAVDEEVVLSADQAADSKVTPANKEKPEAQPIHVLDPVGLTFKNIPAQEMNAPDMDDVLEKLASEFERQESLSRFNS